MTGLIRCAVVLCVLELVAAPASAQVNTGEIFGRANDASGAVVPGVTVTLTGAALIRPQTVVTSATGGYRFPQIPIGTYTVSFDLAGFNRVDRDGIVIPAGFTAEVTVTLELSDVRETVTVSGATPIIDPRSTQLGHNFSKVMLDRIPTARDPWAAIEQTPGIVLTLQNVGGSTAGQQPAFNAHDASAASGANNPSPAPGGAAPQVWTIDGGTTTDVSSNSSTTYFDFDSLEEINIQTAGGDASNANPGITINLITKSGGNTLRGSARLFATDQKFGSLNITDALRRQGAGAGNPIEHLEDDGADVGGPIVKNRAWFYGATAKNRYRVGILGFYKPDAACAAVAANAIAFPLSQVYDCLNTDLTKIASTNLKLQWQEAPHHKTTYGFTRGDKYRGARGADPFNPIETTFVQSGPTNINRLDHQWTISDRFTTSGMLTWVDSGFRFDFQDPSLIDVQPINYVDTGFHARSATNFGTVRPSRQAKGDGNYYWPDLWNGDHALKFGLSYRTTPIASYNQVGGGAIVRIRASGVNEADVTRDGLTSVERWEESAYVTDAYTIGRATINAGVRFDRYRDRALAATIPANRILPDYLPAVAFAGADSGVRFSAVVPRLGVIYDLSGHGRTVIKASLARYSGVGVSTAEVLQPTGPTTLHFKWTDLNGDLTVQRNELVMGSTLADSFIAPPSSNYNVANPSATVTPATVDPGLKPNLTDEAIAGLDHELIGNLAVGARYIFRHYYQNRGRFTVGAFTSEYAPVTFTAACGNVANGTPSCDQPTYTATYYQRATALPAATILRNSGTWMVYHGVELTARKRFADRWMLNASYTWDHGVFHEPQADRDYLDPTNVAITDGASDGVVPWVFKLSGMYVLPWNISASAFLNARSGFTYNTTLLSPNRTGSGGTVSVLLQPYASLTYPTFKELDLALDKAITLGGGRRLVLEAAVFNVTNNNTVLGIVTRQNVTTANNVTSLLAPRVARLGLRFSF